jgi:hypothetical protein
MAGHFGRDVRLSWEGLVARSGGMGGQLFLEGCDGKLLWDFLLKFAALWSEEDMA